MGVTKKTFKKLGLVKLKFNHIAVLHNDFLAFKGVSQYLNITHYELFGKMLQYLIGGLKYDYRRENNELFMKLATITNVVREY